MKNMKKEQVIGNEQGVCPVCKGSNVTYGSSFIEDEYIAYDIHCDDCKANGKEWYRLNYAETTMIKHKDTKADIKKEFKERR